MHKMEDKIIDRLKQVYDPEIPVNVYDLGLIYNIALKENEASGIMFYQAEVTMTLTAPGCPVAEQIKNNIEQVISEIEEIKETKITLVFEPRWDKSMMSEEAKLELGFV